MAIRSAIRGFSVTVFEANETVGGKIGELGSDGFRFDMGPSVLTMPSYIDELFELAGEDPREHFNYKRLEPVFNYLFDDGTLIQTHDSIEKTIAELAGKTSVKKEDLIIFFKRAERKLELTDPVFLQRSLHKWRNYFDKETAKGVLNFNQIEAFVSMAESNAKLFKDEKVEAIFNQYAGYNGSSPFLAPATLNLIAYYELGLGAFYPEGGMRSVITALHNLAKRVGVKFELNAKVESIVTKGNRASGVLVNGAEKQFDRIISNADVQKTFEMIPEVQGPKKILNQPRSSSAIVFFCGIKGENEQLGLHNMFMSSNQQAENQALFEQQDLSDDPTVYLYISSKMNRSDAPEGHENWFVMVPTPHNSGQDWDEMVAKARASAINKISKRLGVDVGSMIVSEHQMDPRDLESKTGSWKGSIYGNSSNGMFAAFLRHPNFSQKIKNLYFCGGSVHPGSGIPLCLLSAKITSGLIGEHSD